MPIKDAEDQLIKIFHRDGPEFVKDASDFHAIIGMGVASILGRHKKPVCLVTVLVQVRGVVMAIPQHETDFGGYFAQQHGRWFTIGDIGWGQDRRESVAGYYRWPRLARRPPRAGSGQADAARDSQSGQARRQGGLSNAAPTSDALGTARTRSGPRAAAAFLEWAGRAH